MEGTIYERFSHLHLVALETFINAATKHGYPRNPDYNGGYQEGVGYFQLSINRGFRVSASEGHLRPALKKGNIKLITNAPVNSILCRSNTITLIAI